MGEAITNREPPALATFEEFIAWLDEDTHAEWVAGEVALMSPVSSEHDAITGYLHRLLSQFCEFHDAGRVSLEPFQMRLASSSRSPDLMVITTPHRDRLKKSYLDGPADLVVEIMSPESRARDRGDKYFEYEQAGVGEYWLIDPERRQAEFCCLDSEGVYQLAGTPDGVFQSKALPGLWVAVGWLWERPKLLTVMREWGMLG